MQYIGIIVFVICVVHFVYQTIVLPSYRQSARDELFVLRDELRSKFIEVQDTCDKNTTRAFIEIDKGINRSINRLHMLTISNLAKANTEKQRDHVRYNEWRRKFHSLLESAEDKTPLETFDKVGAVLNRTLLANTFMLIIYLLPIFLVIKLVSSLYRRLKDSVDYVTDYLIVAK